MKSVWGFSFECSGVAKVGGLAEAVFNMMNQLSKKGFDSTLFMPSHGVQADSCMAEKLKLEKSKVEIRGKVLGKRFLPYRGPFRYRIGVWRGKVEGVNVVLFGGLDERTARILDERVVYKTGLIMDKALLLARGIKGYIENLSEFDEQLPDILHAHDYHAVPAAVLAKQSFERLGHRVALVLTIHLLSKARVSWEYLDRRWCGIIDEKHPVYLDGQKKLFSYRKILSKARGYLEAFGAMESHVFTTVSENYLEDEIMRFLGPSCDCKKGFIWNGCDWEYKALLMEVYRQHRNLLQKLFGKVKVERFQLREYLLTRALEDLKPEEPILDEGMVKDTVYGLEERPFLGRGRVEAFSEDGPMVLMTGRLSEQKGVDTLFRAIPRVIRKIPEVKFVLLLLPTQDELKLVRKAARFANKYRDSVRVVFGKVPSIYFLAHVSSDVFTCPSKWEPFGIMALEAMATGNPVVATKTGGLKETVVDVNEDVKNATGILVDVKDYRGLARALVSLVATMVVQEKVLRGDLSEGEKREFLNLISYDVLKRMVLKDLLFGSKIRENCILRVENNFRWSKVIRMLIEVYRKAESIVRMLEG